MIPWRLFPFVRPCLALIAGIVCEENDLLAPIPLLLLVLIALLVVGLNDFLYTQSLRYPFLAGYFILLIFFSLGYFAHYVSHYTNESQNNKTAISGVDLNAVIGVVEEYPNPRKNFKTKLSSTWICDQGRCNQSEQKMLVSFGKNSASQLLPKPGDKVCVIGKIQKLKTNTNPATFDYALYMRRQGICYQLYAQGHYFILDDHQLPLPKQWSIDVRNRCLAVLDKYMKGDERAVAKAMILGFRQEVDKELYQTFSTSGTMHILAVSGMHLAIIANILLGFVKVIKRKKEATGWLSFVIVLIILWFFSFMTGSESAIVRSALMFSFILLGKTNRHHQSAYNVMAFCALVMLVYDSQQLFNVGFLFSYLALLSLMFFQPIIEKWWLPPDRFSLWVWQFVAASLAAQILVAPLTIFLFHQFPTYFVIAGFIPVWVSALALKCGLLLISLEFVYSELNDWIAPVLNYLFTFFIQSVQWIESLPFASIGPYYLSEAQFVLLHVSLAALMWFAKLRSFRALLLMLSTLFMAVSLSFISGIQQNEQLALTFYEHKHKPLLDVFAGRYCISYGDSLALTAQAENLYKHHRNISGIENVIYMSGNRKSLMLDGNQFYTQSFTLGDFSFEWLRDQASAHTSLIPHIYIVSEKTWPTGNALPHCAPVILDSSVKGKRLVEWKNYLEWHGHLYYSVEENGALILKKPFNLLHNEK